MGNKLTTNQIQQIKHAFDHFDQDGDGEITLEEFQVIHCIHFHQIYPIKSFPRVLPPLSPVFPHSFLNYPPSHPFPHIPHLPLSYHLLSLYAESTTHT
jgi:EF hand